MKPEDDLNICDNCDGTREQWGETCLVCGGTGKKYDELPDEDPPYIDDSNYQDYVNSGPECDHCGGENTKMNEPIPSMMGYGSDDSWTCSDCGKTSFSDPLGRPSRMRNEGAGEFDKFMDRILINEGHHRLAARDDDSPQRRRAARHQDRPLNKIRYGSK
jgi:hypothetical protein